MRIPRIALGHVPAGVVIVGVERMSRAFTKYHLDDGRALHRFRQDEPLANPHDHPWAFETEILAGGYIEEVFHPGRDGCWHSERIHRIPGRRYAIAADHIHRIVELPADECWTIVKAGRQERITRFWRFDDRIRSRVWNERRWMRHE